MLRRSLMPEFTQTPNLILLYTKYNNVLLTIVYFNRCLFKLLFVNESQSVYFLCLMVIINLRPGTLIFMSFTAQQRLGIIY